LHALEKLHELKADLGDPVEVAVAGGRVVVNGRDGISPQRQRQIQSALEGIPSVAVEFANSTPAAEQSAAPPAPAEPTPPQSTAANSVAARVEKQLGGRPQFERFSSQMLDWSEEAMSRAYALRGLAAQFSPAQEALLDAADRRALRAMAEEHAAALDSTAGRMARTLDPVLTGLGGQPASASQSADNWQTAGEDLLQTALRVDKNLSVLIGASNTGSSAFSASGLLADLARMEADIARCRRLLGQ
jgi:hypothetical protein